VANKEILRNVTGNLAHRVSQIRKVQVLLLPQNGDT